MPTIHRDSAALFLKESTTATHEIDSLFKEYRGNTTKVLALATGATTLFGFNDSIGRPYYFLALIAYGGAVLCAMRIFWPRPWKVNVAADAEEAIAADANAALTPTKVMFDLARGYQDAFRHNSAVITDRAGVSDTFEALVLLSSSVVIIGGLGVVFG
ncbi:MAG: hypothetical protein AAGA65_25760 [Actinomycetota bacterium]